MAKISKETKATLKHLHQAMVAPMEAKITEPPSTLDLKASEVPEIKNWDVGKTYTLTLKVKMKSKSEGGYDGKQPLRGSFTVVTANDTTDSEGSSDYGDTEDD